MTFTNNVSSKFGILRYFVEDDFVAFNHQYIYIRLIPFKGPLKTYKHWHTGQPKMGTPGDNCVAYSHDTQDWSTFPCNTTKLGWVCEFGRYTKLE